MKEQSAFKSMDWSNKDLDYIRKNYQLQTDREIANALGRTLLGIVSKRTKLRLFRPVYRKNTIKEALKERDNIIRIRDISNEMKSIISKLESEPNLYICNTLKVKLINLQNINIRL